ncbi:MAG TPA: WS/DGAT domain-containing protein, partial [Solirubrobacteraceae bacterium]|nr:WS/DGAT domain-containing protein [Solirubrobacteraceae bacterium]
ALERLVSDLGVSPLDRSKPLWDIYLVEGYRGGMAMISRIHHCIADGIALAGVLLSLTDSGPQEWAAAQGGDAHRRDAHANDPAPGAAASTIDRAFSALLAPARGTLASVADAANATRRLTGALARESAHTLTHPRRVLELSDTLSADTRAAAKLLSTPKDARSPLKRDLSTQRQVAWSRPLSLARVKTIAHAQDATVNDVLLAAVSGALRAYLLERGEQPQALRTLVPVNLRPLDRPVPDELGNRFGLVFLTLPVDCASRRERLRELKARMDAIKHSSEGPVSYAMLEAAGLAPVEIERRIIDFFTAKASAVMTNVPGPRETVYLAGCPLRTVLIWAPTAGSVGMSVSIFSYDGNITIGLLVHSVLVPNPEAIVDRVRSEIAALARLAPAASRTGETQRSGA